MEIQQAKLMPTKNGNGYKIVVGEKWLYASRDAFERMLDGDLPSVTFREIKNEGNKIPSSLIVFDEVI